VFSIQYFVTTLFGVNVNMYKYIWSNWANNSSLFLHGLLFYAVGRRGLRARVWWTDRPSVPRMIYEWIWNMSGMILTRISKIPRQKLLASATSSTKNPTRTALEVKPGRCGLKLATIQHTTATCTDPFPNGFIRDLFMHGGVSWVAVCVRLTTWVTQRYSDSISRHPKSRGPSWRFIYKFEWPVWRDTEL